MSRLEGKSPSRREESASDLRERVPEEPEGAGMILHQPNHPHRTSLLVHIMERLAGLVVMAFALKLVRFLIHIMQRPRAEKTIAPAHSEKEELVTSVHRHILIRDKVDHITDD